jgi:hypothetical protein
MPLAYETPENALAGLIEAYRTLDIDEIVRNKDFDLDSRLFWEDLGLPISAEKLIESRKAFETNFRSELQSGIPDYGSVAFRVASKQYVQDDFVILTVEGTTNDKKTFQLMLPVYLTKKGWRVVLHPRYDHL